MCSNGPGPKGFMQARWIDGSAAMTEVPNIMHQSGASPVLKKPSASKQVVKKHAMKKHKEVAAPPQDEAADADDEKEMVLEKLKSKKNAAALKKSCEITFEFPENRLELFPNGCSKCRGRRGCTRSCWIYRLRLNKFVLPRE